MNGNYRSSLERCHPSGYPRSRRRIANSSPRSGTLCSLSTPSTGAYVRGRLTYRSYLGGGGVVRIWDGRYCAVSQMCIKCGAAPPDRMRHIITYVPARERGVYGDALYPPPRVFLSIHQLICSRRIISEPERIDYVMRVCGQLEIHPIESN